MNYELKNVIILIILIVNIAASPSQPSMNHEVNQAKQDYPSPEWERELLELRSLAPRQAFNVDREDAGFDSLSKHDWKKSRAKHFKKANVTTDFLDLQHEDMDFPLPHLTTATVNFHRHYNSSNTLENELKGLNKNNSNNKKLKSATKKDEDGEEDYDDYEDEDGDENYLRENDDWMETTQTPTAETTSSYDSLVESLTIFLGSPERSSEISSRRSHKSNKEIDFKGLTELDTVRKMGKGANIPQDLVDAVDPEADENLLELMVRIAENPVEWRNVHKAMQRLDRAMLTSDKILSHSYEKKEIGKRSSPYREERKKKQKHAKLRKRKGNYRYSDKWTKDFLSEKQRKGRKNRTKSRSRHRAKNKNKPKELLHPFKSSSSTPGKIRHGTYENENSDYGKYSENSINSVIEKLRLNKNGDNPYTFADLKPKSAPFEFNNSENKNFERWKTGKWPEWPNLNNYRPKTISSGSSTGFETKYHHSRHRDSSFKKKLKEIRRWGLLKQNRKNLFDNWSSRSNEVDENNSWKDDKNNVKTVGKEDSKLAEKAKMLAANNWSAPEGQKEKVWPHFSYHRVTSSPSVQQRDAGAQPRHRSAYVAVSVIPSNDTGNTLRKNPPKSDTSQKTNPQHKIQNGYSKNRSLPDLFNQLVDNKTLPDDQEKNSLRTIEERFHFKNEDRTRLQQVMRDANSSNKTTLF